MGTLETCTQDDRHPGASHTEPERRKKVRGGREMYGEAEATDAGGLGRVRPPKPAKCCEHPIEPVRRV